MNAAEYKSAKDRSQIKVADIWRAATGVTPDQDKSYGSGRTPIADATGVKVNTLLARIEASADELRTVLQSELPEGCSVDFDQDRLHLMIRFSTSGEQVKVERKGVDLLNHAEVYEVPGAALFLRVRPDMPGMGWVKNPTWMLWRGQFVAGPLPHGPIQSAPNRIKASLLRQVFHRWT